MSDRKEWYMDENGVADEFFASSVTVFRNFASYKFMNTIDGKSAESIVGFLEKSFGNSKKYEFARLEDAFNDKYQFYEKVRFSEEWKISRNFIESTIPHGIITDGKNLFVTVNDTEHINASSYFTGKNLEKAYNCCMEFLSEDVFKNKFAFSDEFGYLMGNAETMGSGVKAQIVMNIPSICLSQSFEKFNRITDEYDIAVEKPFYGVDPKETGFISVGSKDTMTCDGLGAIEKLNEAAEKIAELERTVSEVVLTDNFSETEDILWRALGTLRYARTISVQEGIKCISLVNFGIDRGIITDKEKFSMADIIFSLWNAGLSDAADNIPEPGSEDRARAEYLRNIFKK